MVRAQVTDNIPYWTRREPTRTRRDQKERLTYNTPPHLVEIEYFRHQSYSNKDKQEVNEPVLELIITHNRGDDSCRQYISTIKVNWWSKILTGSETSGTTDAQSTNQTTDGNIPEHALISVPRGNEDNDSYCWQNDETAPYLLNHENETLLSRITLILLTRKPGARNSFWKSSIWPTVSSFGPFRAMTTLPS